MSGAVVRANLPDGARKQRAVVLADLARLRVRQNEIDEACRLVAEAKTELAEASYATAAQRLTVVRDDLSAWKDHPGVKRLNELFRN